MDGADVARIYDLAYGYGRNAYMYFGGSIGGNPASGEAQLRRGTRHSALEKIGIYGV